MFEDLKGKSILIVGCSKGIGKNLVSALQYFSPSLHLISRNNPNISEFENLTTSFYPLDITQEDDYDTKLKELPKLDGVCFIAGSIRLTPPAMMNKKLNTNIIKINKVFFSLFAFAYQIGLMSIINKDKKNSKAF